MDMNALLSTMLSGDSVESIGKLAGASTDEVKSVLGSALPQLLSGAQGQATDQATAEGFAQALSDHALADTSDVRGFLSGVDLIDGGKIIAHLLGGNLNSTTTAAAASSGLDAAKVSKILAIAAPLLMSLLGKQTGQAGGDAAGIGTLMSAFLGKTDTASLVQTLLFGKKKQKGLLGLLLGGK